MTERAMRYAEAKAHAVQLAQAYPTWTFARIGRAAGISRSAAHEAALDAGFKKPKPPMSPHALANLNRTGRKRIIGPQFYPLLERLVAERHSNREIAARFGLSVWGVIIYKRRLGLCRYGDRSWNRRCLQAESETFACRYRCPCGGISEGRPAHPGHEYLLGAA